MQTVKAWLQSIPVPWIAWWLILPNLLLILMWPIGGPAMQPPLLLFGLAALAVSQLPWPTAKRLLLLAMMAGMAAYYVCMLFNISPLDIWILPAFVREVHPWRSPEYVAAAVVFVGIAALALFRAPRVPRFASLRTVLMGLAAVFAFSQLDHAATAASAGSYHATPQAGSPFTSATRQAGLFQPPASRHHVLVVLVEGLGMPAGAAERRLFEADWNRPHWNARYQVKHGLVPYYGSTTNGELRELCGEWGQYFRFDYSRAECLPKIYREAGYETTAMHAFDGSFFDRQTWWPMLGFQHANFEQALIGAGARHCGGVFPGACDTDLPRQIAARLEHASKPQLVYWVTLNTHLPVIADPELGTASCPIGEPAWREANPQFCRMFLLHHRLADALDAMLMDPSLPPTDVVIVGDHMPPFLGREKRFRFDPAHVPYVFLRAKERAASHASV